MRSVNYALKGEQLRLITDNTFWDTLNSIIAHA